MKKKRFLPLFFLFSFCILFALPVNGKSSNSFSLKEKKIFRKAETHFLYSEYDDAIPLYMVLLSSHSDDLELNYEAGISYFYSTTSRPMSVKYLEKAIGLSVKDTSLDLVFHMARAYQCVNDFTDAEKFYIIFRHETGNDLTRSYLDEFIAQCETGKKYWAAPGNVQINSLGPNVNSIYPDYAPVLTRDHSKLLFTSKREGTTGGKKDDDGFYYEDVYMARSGANWNGAQRIDTSFHQPKFYDMKLFFGKAENISQINTSRHDASIALSPDETSLYIFRSDDIWKADLKDDQWQSPVRISRSIDASRSYEPSVFITHDGNMLYFISDRKGGVGGKDIWQCTKNSNGDWGEPVNLGAEINSDVDEDSPFVTDDGNTLYFSSQGHSGMGGYDVFKSVKDANGKWSTPENLGAPVNNGDDDIFYYPDQNGNRAWYATLNRNGEGSLDIYEIDYLPEFAPLAKIHLKETTTAMEDVSISLRGINGQKDTSLTFSNNADAIFPFVNNSIYLITVSANGFGKFTDTLKLESDSPYNFIFQELTLTKYISDTGTKELLVLATNYTDIDKNAMTDSAMEYSALPASREKFISSVKSAQELQSYTTSILSDVHSYTKQQADTSVLASVYFDFDHADLRLDMHSRAEAIFDWMKKNPESSILLAGNTDDKGADNYNIDLSRERASAVRDFLVSKGIDRKRVTVVANGEKDPVAPNENKDGNDNPSGRALNRRVDIRKTR
ncbi:MAG: OmpA family protein [Bacteroidetes bacterium]|nr:OmpA family protein [Bacteroidota bacterium]